jgi:transposase
VLEHNFNWKSLSAVAGLTLLSFHSQLYAGAGQAPQVVDFLKALVRHIGRPVVVVWDRLPSLHGQIQLEYLPPYAPELNPVENIWAHSKQHELPNVCPRTSGNSATPLGEHSSGCVVALG